MRARAQSSKTGKAVALPPPFGWCLTFLLPRLLEQFGDQLLRLVGLRQSGDAGGSDLDFDISDVAWP